MISSVIKDHGGITLLDESWWILSSEQSEGRRAEKLLKQGHSRHCLIFPSEERLLLKMPRCGCCRWRQNEVVSCGGEAPAGFPLVFWPLRNVDSCLGYN